MHIAVLIMSIISVLIVVIFPFYYIYPDRKFCKSKRWRGIWLVALVIVLIIFIPLIINELYRFPNECLTLWGAPETLAYYGSVLSFIGTVALGALALYQTKVIEQERARPRFGIQAETSHGSGTYFMDPEHVLHIPLHNFSQNYAHDLSVCEIQVLDSSGQPIYNSENALLTSSSLPPDDTNFIEINLKNTRVYEDGYIFSMKMTCKNASEKKYRYIITGVREKGSLLTQTKFRIDDMDNYF